MAKQLLERGMPYLVADKFGQAQALPSNETKVINFYRYNALPSDPVELVEGVTPAGRKISRTIISATLKQYGDFIEISDVVKDTTEDHTIQGSLDALAQQAAEMGEKLILSELKAGASAFYANNVAGRGNVNAVLQKSDLNRAVRLLLRQNAKKVTKVVRSTPDFGTDNVHPSFIALCPVEVIPTIRAMNGFIDAKDYGALSPYPNEIGAVDEVRFLYHTLLTGWDGQGTSGGSSVLETGGNANVYPIIIFGQDAYANIALRGEFAVSPMVVSPKPAPGDALGQRGSIGWKMMKVAKILNDAWVTRIEVAAPV
jgi:N4-gp56 family major capsid protein